MRMLIPGEEVEEVEEGEVQEEVEEVNEKAQGEGKKEIDKYTGFNSIPKISFAVIKTYRGVSLFIKEMLYIGSLNFECE